MKIIVLNVQQTNYINMLYMDLDGKKNVEFHNLHLTKNKK